MTTLEEKGVHEALRVIVQNKDQKALNYCVNYAQAGMSMTGYALHIQALYALGNMTHWRGDVAKSVRNTLKAYIKNSK